MYNQQPANLVWKYFPLMTSVITAIWEAVWEHTHTLTGIVSLLYYNHKVALVNKLFRIKLHVCQKKKESVLSEKFVESLLQPEVCGWKKERKGDAAETAGQKEHESNKELYLSHKTNHVANITEREGRKKTLLSESFELNTRSLLRMLTLQYLQLGASPVCCH